MLLVHLPFHFQLVIISVLRHIFHSRHDVAAAGLLLIDDLVQDVVHVEEGELEAFRSLYQRNRDVITGFDVDFAVEYVGRKGVLLLPQLYVEVIPVIDSSQ